MHPLIKLLKEKKRALQLLLQSVGAKCDNLSIERERHNRVFSDYTAKLDADYELLREAYTHLIKLKEEATNLHTFLPPPDEADARLAEAKRELARAQRTLKNIRNLIPSELLRPKGQHLILPAMQRIHNELTKYENGK